MELIALALAPGIAICIYIFYRDLYNREPKLNLVVSFLLGCLAIIPAIVLESVFIINGHSIGAVALFAYGVVALSEEGCKFFFLRTYAYTRKSFDEPLDGIVYSVMVSMGFATVENLFYVMNYAALGQGLQVGIQRMFLSVPAHASFAVVMGYYIGKAKFAPGKRTFYMLTGLLIAVFFHGTYDFFLFIPKYTKLGEETGNLLLAGGAIGSYIICLILSRKMIRAHKKISEKLFKDNQYNA